MCSSSLLMWFALVSMYLLVSQRVCTFQLVSSKISSAPAPGSHPSSSVRRKLDPLPLVMGKGKVQAPLPPPEEDDIRFCTLANFQNCISELWPGGSPSMESAAPLTRSKSSSSESPETTTGATPASVPASDLAFPTTFRELQATCSDLKERVRCLDRHSERCFTPEMLQVFGHIVTNAKQFVHDLCDNKRVQSGNYPHYSAKPNNNNLALIEFLVHAKCFRNISLDEQKCAQEYRDAIRIPVSEPKGGAAAQARPSQSRSLGTQPYETLPNAAKLVSAGEHAQQHQIKELIMQRSCW